MAKADYIRPVEALHGKLKKTDKVGFAKLKRSGTKFTVTRDDWKQHYKTAEAATAAQMRQQKFRSVSMAASERMQDPTKKTADRSRSTSPCSRFCSIWNGRRTKVKRSTRLPFIVERVSG